MRLINPVSSWPQLWKDSYSYDQLEVYEGVSNLGYRYAYQNRKDKTIAMVTAALQPGARILDVAASQGNFTIALAQMGYLVTWNDLRSELIDYVKMKDETETIEYAPGNVLKLEFGELFDGVLITEIIEHVAHPDEFLRAIAKVVRPGGYVFMTTPNGSYIRNKLPRFSDFSSTKDFEAYQFRPDGDGHIFLLYEDEIRDLSGRAGLLVEGYELFTTPLTNGHMKTSAVLPKLPRSVVFAIENIIQKLPRSVSKKFMIQCSALLRRPTDGFVE